MTFYPLANQKRLSEVRKAIVTSAMAYYRFPIYRIMYKKCLIKV